MRVLYLTHRLPYAPNRGDRIRAYHTARVLSAHAEVHLVSLVHDAEEASHLDEASRLVRSIAVVRVPQWATRIRAALALPGRRPLTHVLLDAPGLNQALRTMVAEHPPDMILAYCSGMARLAMEPILSSRPFVLDMVDLDSAKWASLSASAGVPMRWIYLREAARLSTFEARAASRAVTTLVVNERERAALARLAPDAKIDVVENGVDLEHLRPNGPPAEVPQVIFCGVMNYGPNEAAAIWLAERVWPAVRRARPDAQLVLCGSEPTPAVLRLQAEAQGITVTGRVPDVRPHLWNSAVAAAPLQIARGIQNKVLEAVAAGLPAVITPVVREGLPADVLPACRTAGDPEAFAAALVDLLGRSAAERRAIAELAALDALTWETRLAPLVRIVRSTRRLEKRTAASIGK